jgi:hypothetical protein
MNVLIVIGVIAVVIYPRRNVFIDEFVFTLKAIGLHIKISAKEKNGPPNKSDRSNHE